MSDIKLDAFGANQTFEVGAGQELTPVTDGYMIYKSATEKVHYLNPTASILYELCGAGYSVERMGGFLKQAYALDTDPFDMVHEGLVSLVAEDLVSPCGQS